MFSGIVEEMGTVQSNEKGQMHIAANRVLKGLKPGDSIAVNGACLTITSIGRGSFSVDVVPETLRRTNLGLQKPGEVVNLERPLVFGGRVGGHLVQGHVDDTGEVLSLTPQGNAVIARFKASRKLMRYIVEKGFVALDGVSLTVVEKDRGWFSISLIPYTIENTTLGRRKPGEVVNLEVDIIAKYVEEILPARKSLTRQGSSG
ncbi:MAG: riboflavin synthase [Chloroflexi bacterium]|nr:riboflavin synthase [Chloroflexota bacterium]